MNAVTSSRSVVQPVAQRRRKIAIALAFAGSLPTPLPLTWLHKFYLGQYLWGIVYLVLAPTLLPKVACCLEGLWYLSQSDEHFLTRFPQAGLSLSGSNSRTDDSNIGPLSGPSSGPSSAQATQQMADALRELERLRQEGLMTEYEFEQKRRKLLEGI